MILKKRKENKTPSPLVLSIMLAQKNEEEKGGILKYLPPLYLPLLSFTLTEMVPQPFSVGHPTVFLLAVTKSAVTNGFLPPVHWVKREYPVFSPDQRFNL